MKEQEINEIRQNGKSILTGDSTSIHVIFNNMTGKNFEKDPEGYRNYKALIKSQGVDLNSPIVLYENGKFVKTGTIRLFTNEK